MDRPPGRKYQAELPTFWSLARTSRIVRIVFSIDVNELDWVAVAVILLIVEARTSTSGVQIAGRAIRSFNATVVVALVDSTNCLGNIAEFLDKRITDNCPANSGHAEGQRDDQHEFRRNEKAVFVVDESAQHV